MKAYLAGAIALVAASSGSAQSLTATTPAAPQQAAPVPAQSVAVLEPVVAQNILRAGTEIPLRTREELTTKKKKLRVGQRVQLEVASNVEANGVVVVPQGTPAVAELTEVRNKGMWGKSGYIGARIISMRLGDRQVRLSGTFDDKGVTGTGGVVASVVLIPLAGFFTTGTSAEIPSGSAMKGFLDEDIVFRTVAAPPAVLEVPVPAPVATATAPAS